jgi:tRNA(Arg) A34 adenosine deaminase TadA
VSPHFFPRDEYFMRLALREASRALEHDDVPIGAVIVREGEVIGLGHNEREVRGDPTAHAEMIALREGARSLGTWRVLDSVMYITLEPCAMCAGAIVLARVPRWPSHSSTTAHRYSEGFWRWNARSCSRGSSRRGADRFIRGIEVAHRPFRLRRRARTAR